MYVTGRPDMQKHRVVAWLSQHNFPHGVLSFCDGLTHDPLRQKAMFLQSLVQEVQRCREGCWGPHWDPSFVLLVVQRPLCLSPSRPGIAGYGFTSVQLSPPTIAGHAPCMSSHAHTPASLHYLTTPLVAQLRLVCLSPTPCVP